jgi:hypothetical protein
MERLLPTYLDLNPNSGPFTNTTRLEIISDVVSEKARSGKIPIPHRFFPIPHRFFPISHRFFPMYFRCGIGISNVVSEFFRYVPFRYHIGNYF